MAYQWKSEKIVLVTLPEGKFGKQGPLQEVKETKLFGGTLSTVKGVERISVPMSW